MTDWGGVFPAVTTKFNEDFQLDLEAMEVHFAWQVESGVDGLITTGSLGEASTLTPVEKVEVAKVAIAVAAKRLPVVATVAETTTIGAIRFAEAAAKAGVDGLMVLPGMQYVSDRREAVTHLRGVAEAVDLPIMAYCNPVAYRTDIDILALEELAETPNVIAIKESSDDVRRVTDIRGRFGERFLIFAGVDNLALESFCLGADGWVAGLVNAFPAETVAVYQLAKAGRLQEARDIYRWFSPLLRLDVSTKLVQNIKLVEQMLGVGDETVRPPRLPLTGDERNRVEEIVHLALRSRPDVSGSLRAA
jgi:4-hydroxy-tetrahydrodipicolinate synthase